jgi:glycosyltransferase involved in cell wall biosynthesis
MKIASMLLTDLGNFGGVEVFTLNFLNRVSSLGHDCTLFLTKEAIDNINATQRSFGFKIQCLGVKRAMLFRRAPFLMRLVIRWLQYKHQFDIWQIMGAFPGAGIGSVLRVPSVLRAHGDDIQKDFRLDYGVTRIPSRRRFVVKSLKSIDRVVAMTQAMEESFLALEVPESRIVRIPNGANLDRFRKDFDRVKIRTQLGISKTETVFITVGRYHLKKGHDLIPRIALNLKAQGKRFKWILVGQGVSILKSDVERLGLLNDIILHEKIRFGSNSARDTFSVPSEDLIAILKSCDVFIFPTRLEGFPMVTIEAMAAGLPIVTTNSPGTGELFQHEHTAMLSDVDDIAAIVQNITEVMSDENLRKRLSRNGLQEVWKYDIDVVVRRYVALYEKLLASGKDVYRVSRKAPKPAALEIAGQQDR